MLAHAVGQPVTQGGAAKAVEGLAPSTANGRQTNPNPPGRLQHTPDRDVNTMAYPSDTVRQSECFDQGRDNSNKPWQQKRGGA